jgi:pimeloyl-ACP methyl ester carboxylesterase
MQIDRQYLESHAKFAADGIEEKAFHFDVGSDQCFGILYAPSNPSSMGFVVCHSYALELLTLRRIERAIARRLASLGHPVLAFHSRGYGDSTGTLADATVERHLEDIRAGADRLITATGIGELGLIGARFGALTAGLFARRADIRRLILVDPEFSGTRYFRGLIRDKYVVELANGESGTRTSADDHETLLRRGETVDLLGYELHGHLYNSLAEVDLTTDIDGFSGEALVMQVTKRSSPSRAAESFAEKVRERGGECSLEIIPEPRGVTIGGPAFVNKNDRNVREDLQEPVVEQMTDLVGKWIST